MKAYREIKKNVSEIDKAFRYQKGFECALTQRQSVAVIYFQTTGKQYLSFRHKMIGEEGVDHSKTFNLQHEEYEQFKRKFDIIDSRLDKVNHEDQTMGEACSNRGVENAFIHPTSGQKYIFYGITSIDKQGKEEDSYNIYAARAKCEEELTEMKRVVNEGAQVSVVEVLITRPNSYLLIEGVIKFMVREGMQKKAEQHCTGCQDEAGNQMAHIFGCLQGLSEQHLDEIITELKEEEVIHNISFMFKVVHKQFYAPISVFQLYESFVYLGGLQKVKQGIKDRESKLYRMIETEMQHRPVYEVMDLSN